MANAYRRPIHEGVTVMSRCWCDSEFVYVRAEDVWAGRTLPCRRRSCRPPSCTA